MIKKQQGFTLIELLIVIVIIGILAGVLISVIDPVSQQNRARDAGIEASINKVVLATEGYVSAYGDVPDEVQFIAQFKTGTVTDSTGAACTTVGSADCTFSVTGNGLPENCGATGWSGEVDPGGNQCYFRYEASPGADPANSAFTIYAKSAGLDATVFKFENSGTNAGTIQQCSATNLNNCN